MTLQIPLTPENDTWNQTIGEADLGAPITEDVEITALEGNDTVTGTAFSDLLFGNEGNDSLDGGAGNDTIYGGQGNDVVTSLSGNNYLLGNIGNDTIVGGTGDDTVYGGQDNDSISGGSGNNSLFGNIGNDTIVGGTGNDYIHGGQNDDLIIASEGVDTLIGGVGNDAFSLSVAGVAGSGDVFEGGDGNDRLDVTATNDISGATVTGIETVSVASTVILTASLANLEDAETLEGSGTIKILATTAEINTFLTTLGAGVASTLTITDQDNNIVRGGDDPGIPISNTLKVGQDNITGSGRFDAPVVFRDTIGNIPTLESVDVLAGTGDADILTATMDGTVFGGNNTLNIVPSITGIETISIRAIQNVGYNAINTRGTTTFISSASPADLNITNLQELPTDFIARNNSGSFTATIGDSVLSGGSDSINITLENTNALGEVISIGSINGTQGIETFNINSTGVIVNRLDAILDQGFNDLTTVNISGNNSLELVRPGVSVLPASVTVIDASELEANLVLNDVIVNQDLAFTGGTGDVDLVFGGRDLTFTGGTGDVTLDFTRAGNRNLNYVGGEGNVTIDMGNNLDADDTIDGGVGENTITANFNANVDPLEIKNVQTLLLTVNNVSSISFEDSDNSIELIRLTNANANPPALSVEAIKSLPTIEFQGDGNGTNFANDPATNSIIFSNTTIISTGVSGADDTLTVEVNNQGNQLDNRFGYEFRGVRADGVENIELNIADGSLGFEVDADGNLVNVPTGDIRARGLKTVTVTSADNVRLGDINTVDGNNTITTINATGITGRFNATSGDLAANAVVNLGNGINVFSAAATGGNAGNAGVTINGAGGNDDLTGSQGNDTITGGAGADTIRLVAGGIDRVQLNQTATTDTITTFGFNDDIIGLSQGTYNTLSVGQKYDILATGGINAGTNLLTTIVQGTEANVEGLAQANTSRIRFAIVTGIDADADGANDDTSLFYSATGNFTNIDNANRIANLIDFNGFAFEAGTNFVVPIA